MKRRKKLTRRQMSKAGEQWLAKRSAGPIVAYVRPVIDLTRLAFHEACAELRATFRPGLYLYRFPDKWQVPPRDRNEEWLFTKVLANR